MINTYQATILIIDDEEAIRQSYADFLEDLEYRTLTAENGRKGLEIFEHEKVDLVLVDLRMPEVDGLEVLGRLTKTSPDTPTIMVSGTGVIGDAIEALHQGAWDYLLKPIEDFSVLTHAVTNALEKARLKRENRKYQQHLEHMVDERTKELKQHREHLEDLVKERTIELEKTHMELVDKAHKAGMADVAIETLHNIGNILTSIKTSTQVIVDIASHSHISGLERANRLLKENMDNLADFITKSTKGKKLMQYYLELEELIVSENRQIASHLDRLGVKIESIAHIIAAQQNYIGAEPLTRPYPLREIVEDALTMQTDLINRESIIVEKEYAPIPNIPVQKTKLLQIMINLIINAREAMVQFDYEKRVLGISIGGDEKGAWIKVKDTGPGIPLDKTSKIFTLGFSTKKGGHGIGLHNCANYMTEMGGEIRVENNNMGKGVTFILKFNR